MIPQPTVLNASLVEMHAPPVPHVYLAMIPQPTTQSVFLAFSANQHKLLSPLLNQAGKLAYV